MDTEPVVTVGQSLLEPVRLLFSRIVTFCLVEVQKLRHDYVELLTRAVQPVLWLTVFGTTFSRIHAIPTQGVSYLAYLAPGVIAQSALFDGTSTGSRSSGNATPASSPSCSSLRRRGSPWSPGRPSRPAYAPWRSRPWCC